MSFVSPARTLRTLTVAASLLALAACGEKAATAPASTTPAQPAASQLETETPSATILGLGNLVPNSSLENLGIGGAPAGWTRMYYGNPAPTFTYPVTGRSGKAAMVSLSANSTGDARWQPAAAPVVGGLKYTLSFWYKSTTSSSVGAEFTGLLGRLSYAWFANLPSSGGTWKQYTATFTVPLFQTRAAIYQSINTTGSLVIDDVALVLGSAVPQSPPPTAAPAPTLTFAANPTSITAGQSVTLTWTSTDADQCTASGLWSGTQPTSGSAVVTPTASGTYSLTCGGSGGSLTKNAAITVSAAPTPTQPGQFAEGLFSFSFDDSWDSQYLNALSILEAGGFKGTFYLTTNQIEQRYQFFMTPEMVKDLAARGHEIAGHTLTHADLATLSAADLQNELVTSRNYLRTLTGKPVNGFAYPYGSYNQNVITAVQQAGYSHARSVDFLSLNTTAAPKYTLYSQCIQNTTTLDEVKAKVDAAKANKQWFILCLHEVKDSGGDNLTITPAFFQQIVAYVKQSGIKVVTVENGFSQLQ